MPIHVHICVCMYVFIYLYFAYTCTCVRSNWWWRTLPSQVTRESWPPRMFETTRRLPGGHWGPSTKMHLGLNSISPAWWWCTHFNYLQSICCRRDIDDNWWQHVFQRLLRRLSWWIQGNWRWYPDPLLQENHWPVAFGSRPPANERHVEPGQNFGIIHVTSTFWPNALCQSRSEISCVEVLSWPRLKQQGLEWG